MRYSKNEVYDYNVGILKRYTDTYYKLINLRAVRKAGFEECKENRTIRGEAGNDGKLDTSLARSRSKVHELASCNPWEMFVTLTVSDKQYDRYNLSTYKAHLSKWINNMNYQKGSSIRYLLIPEPHKDNAWHFHGLMMGIPTEQLTPFSLSDHIPENLKEVIRTGQAVYNWKPYAERFGWVTVSPIIDRERCAKYITKYITKNLMETRIAMNNHVYFASQGLSRAEEVYKGTLCAPFDADYENDYVRVKVFDNPNTPLTYFE